MYKRIDVPVETLKGFSYINKCNNIEQVEIKCSTAKIVLTGNCKEVYYEDIPNLILALQAAYDHNKAK